MKAFNKYFSIPAALLLTLAACEDEKTPVLELVKKAGFNQLEKSEVVITKNNLSEKFPKISWTPADYNGAAVSYTVKMKNSEGGEVDLGETTDCFLELDNSAINSLLAHSGAKPGKATECTFSLQSSAANGVNTDESENSVSIKVTAYDPKAENIDWDFAYVAVGYPKFDFEQSFLIGDPDGDGIYQGYVNIPEGMGTSFAVLDGKTMAVISENNTLNPETNIGFVEIKAGTDGSIEISDKTEWGLIGSATSGSWDKDTKMDFDAKTGVWTAVTSLTDGEFKFRANGGWDINLGGSADNLTYGGDNLKVPAAHAYIVTLNLVNAGKYTYTMEETEIELSSEFLTVPGSFNGWNNQTKDYRVTSAARDFVFSNTLYIGEDNAEFKFYDDASGAWIGIVGDKLEDGSFKIGDGDNIKLDKAGYYKMTVDQKKMTASVVSTGWELIGGAIEPYDWSVGIVMDYDPSTKTWSKTITVKDGEYKFRWAGAWDVNFGGALTGLEQDGANLNISAGTYKFVLDPEKKTATVTAQ